MPGLTKIDTELDGIGHALSDNILSVPVFQRSYAWEDRQVTELFQDIATAISRHENEYFLGSILCTGSTVDAMQIIDGQQRLATITILVAAIRDWFRKRSDSRAEDIEKTYLASADLRTRETIPRLRLGELDNDFFQRNIIEGGRGGAHLAPSRRSHERIEVAAKLAERHVAYIANLTNDPSGALIDWIDYIQKDVRVIWVVVPDEANAFTIFETLNDRGLDLAITDLLKNLLFKLSGDRVAEVQSSWAIMLGMLESTGDESLALDFIRHYWSSQYLATRTKDLYTSIREKVTSKQGAIDLAGFLVANAKTYVAILNSNDDLWNRYGQTARRHVGIIELLGMQQIRPLLLAVLEKFERDDVIKTLRVMVSWGVRFLVSGRLGGGVLESRYCEKAVAIRDGTIKSAAELNLAMREVVPNDAQFREAFAACTVSKANLARYYLRVLEQQARGEAEPELIPNDNQDVVNLEHILPLNPAPEWKMEGDVARALYRKLGNLALLAASPNNDAANDVFLKKREIYACSTFLLTKNLEDYDEWNDAAIQHRQGQLAKFAVDAWTLVVH